MGKKLHGRIEFVKEVKKTRFDPTVKTSDQSEQNIDSDLTSNRVKNDTKHWPKNTTLIIGDSIIGGVEENKLKTYGAKVKSHGGATVDDLHDYIAPLLKKQPANIILHVGTNDAPHKPAGEIYKELLNLMNYIRHILPSVKIHVSCPTLRTDDASANTTLRMLDSKLKGSTALSIIPNDNIDGTCLAMNRFGGLHLNQKGSGRLAMNFIKLLKAKCV